MALFSEKQLTVTSSEDEIIISTPETLTLNGGGSYLRLSKNGIEHGSSGEFIMKTSNYMVPGTGANLPNETPNFSLTDIIQKIRSAVSHSMTDTKIVNREHRL